MQQGWLPGAAFRAAFCVLAVLGIAGAWVADAAVVATLGDARANPGEPVEVSLSLVSEGEAPAALVVFVAFDPALAQPVAGYFATAPGEAQFEGLPGMAYGVGAAAPGDAANAAGKFVDSHVPAPGLLAVGVAGLNANLIGDGVVALLAFQVTPGVAEGATVALRGVDADHPPVMIGDKEVFSTAVRFDGRALALEIADGDINVGCVPAPTVRSMHATRDLPDGVRVRWEAVLIRGATYRVFRSETKNPSLAVALGTGWTSQTEYFDTTAAPPRLIAPGGCVRPAKYEPVQYYYWIKARGTDYCAGPLGPASAAGARALPGDMAGQGCAGQAAAEGRSAAGFGVVHGAALALVLFFAHRSRRRI